MNANHSMRSIYAAVVFMSPVVSLFGQQAELTDISGHVYVGSPSCPADRLTVRLTPPTSSGRSVLVTETDADGVFHLSLPIGEYYTEVLTGTSPVYSRVLNVDRKAQLDIGLEASDVLFNNACSGGGPNDLLSGMEIDVDGAPNAYGPKGKPTLDYELNAHVGGSASGKVVGYITKSDGVTPELQGDNDPFPGYYITETAFFDRNNPNRLDPRRYVDASKVNYVVLGRFGRSRGAGLGDFVVVHSIKTGKTSYGIIADSGNDSSAEGSLALLQALGYPVKDGKAGGVRTKEIIVRYFPHSNPTRRFFSTQTQLDTEAISLGLDKHLPIPR